MGCGTSTAKAAWQANPAHGRGHGRRHASATIVPPPGSALPPAPSSAPPPPYAPVTYAGWCVLVPLAPGAWRHLLASNALTSCGNGLYAAQPPRLQVYCVTRGMDVVAAFLGRPHAVEGPEDVLTDAEPPSDEDMALFREHLAVLLLPFLPTSALHQCCAAAGFRQVTLHDLDHA